MTDRMSGKRFLIDTGAAASVIPIRNHDIRFGRPGPPLVAANGAQIRTFGTRRVNLHFYARRYEWEFIIADVTQPILGADFLCNFGLLVDVRNEQLLDVDSLTSLNLQAAYDADPSLSNISISGPFASLLSEFPDLVTPIFSSTTTKHGVEFFIPTTGPPIHSRFRRLEPDKLRIAKAEFAKMEAMGIIRRSSSPWSSPLHMVSKTDGGWRLPPPK